AMAALAATYETASRGLIYEHRPASLPAERLLTSLRPVLAKAGEGGGSAFERDVAVVLRRTADAVHDVRAADPEDRRAFVELLPRVLMRRPGAGQPAAEETEAEEEAASRLIIPEPVLQSGAYLDAA